MYLPLQLSIESEGRAKIPPHIGKLRQGHRLHTQGLRQGFMEAGLRSGRMLSDPGQIPCNLDDSGLR